MGTVARPSSLGEPGWELGRGMGPGEGSIDPSQCPRPWGDPPAPSGFQPPLTAGGGEAALRLRSSELSLSLQEEPAGQALATLGQVTHLPNRCPTGKPEGSALGGTGAVPGGAVSGNQGPRQGHPTPSPSSHTSFLILSLSFSWLFKHPSA